MSAYATPLDDPLGTLTSAEVSTLVFKKRPGWFGRDIVRKRLYSRGFPHPIERGIWSAAAIKSWLETAGSNPNRVVPKAPPVRKPTPRRRPNGYAQVSPH
jgi:hypothetical protein